MSEGTDKPICYDLCCGLGGWTEAFLAEGYRCIGFDIEAHDYGTGGYPGELRLRDILTLHGSELKDATVIVGSSPCQKYSYMAMPWKRAKAMVAYYEDKSHPERLEELNALFNAQFRIQREASEAAGHYIPLIVENVRGAQKWVGWAKWAHGTFYLWGDVPILMPAFDKGFKGFKGFKRNWRDCEGSRSWSSKSPKRKEWSAMIAKIPYPLAAHIAKSFKPRERELKDSSLFYSGKEDEESASMRTSDNTEIVERWRWLYAMCDDWTKSGLDTARMCEGLRECGSPKNIKPLIEELSRAEQRVTELEENQRVCDGGNGDCRGLLSNYLKEPHGTHCPARAKDLVLRPHLYKEDGR